MKAILVALLVALALSEVIPFNNEAIEKVFKDSNEALFLFVNDEEAESSAIEAFNEYDTTNPGFFLIISTKNDGHGLFERLAEYMGVDINATPKLVYLNSKTVKYVYDYDDVTVENLKSFAERISTGEVDPFLKSAPIPESNDEPVKVVVGKQWDELVMNHEKEVLVKFYAPWCGHCKTLAPHYDEAAKRLANNPNIILVKVDSTENEVAGVDIQGFPTLKFWGKDKTAEPIEYNGGRDADGIISWLRDHTQYEWVEEATEESVDETL